MSMLLDFPMHSINSPTPFFFFVSSSIRSHLCAVKKVDNLLKMWIFFNLSTSAKSYDTKHPVIIIIILLVTRHMSLRWDNESQARMDFPGGHPAKY
jgi:hypothetical protein